ncbi:transposase, IS4 family [Haloechinothrix alba]|uniref:Transposase, IS4 family n=1 Tax=Haloechinothrix alba TaxID=664784 RepID=A0A239ALQ3_9PSEU|nr:transposase, IS4 family [Haloechinothrix alba]
MPDELWQRVEPLLPARAPRRNRYPGRLPVDDRAALAGIVFVLNTGIAWRELPHAVASCSGVTCWRRLRDWTEAAVFAAVQALLLDQLRALDRLDLDTAVVDSSHVRALKRAAATGPSPVDRARPGSKHHLITEGTGIPLAVTVTVGNRHDVTQLLPLVNAIPAIGGKPGRARRRPRWLYGDRGYDYDPHRRSVREKGITPRIARRNTAHGSRLGTVCWVVERAFAWLHQYKRLRTRYERRADIHHGLLQLGCVLICHRQLTRSF